MGQDVHWIGDHKHDGVLAHARLLNAIKDLDEQSHVAVDQIQTGLVWFSPKSGGNEEQIRVSSLVVIPCSDTLVSRESGAMEQIQCFPLSHGLVGIDQMDIGDNPATLQGECRTGSDSSSPSYDGDFHN
jgi:hypothetical protein